MFDSVVPPLLKCDFTNKVCSYTYIDAKAYEDKLCVYFPILGNRDYGLKSGALQIRLVLYFDYQLNIFY